MSMMERMRMGTDSFFIQAVFVIIVASFVFWGVGNTGPSSSTVAEVDGSRITDTEFNNRMRIVSRSQGRTLTDAEYAQMGSTVLGQMIERKVLLAEAESLGIEVSDDEVKRTIYSIPAFQTEDGKFSKALYERYVKSSGSTDAKFREDLYEDLMVSKLEKIAVLSVHVSESQLQQRFIQANSSVAVTWVRVNDAAFLGQVEVTDDEIQALLGTDASRAQARYDAQFERRFKEPAKATLRSILLRTDIPGSLDDDVKARMDLVLADLEGGMDFADAAARWSEDLSAVNGGLLGTQALDQLDPVLTQAVTGTEAGALTPVVQTSRGFQVLLVEEQFPATETPFDEAKELLARELIQEERAPQLATAFAQELHSTWGSSGSLPVDSIMDAGLLPRTESALSLAAPGIEELGSSAELMAAVQDAPAGTLLPVMTISGDQVVAQITARNDADLSQFDEQKAMLRDQARLMEQYEFLQAFRAGLVAQAEVNRYYDPATANK